MKKSLLVLILCMLVLQADIIDNQGMPPQPLTQLPITEENIIDSRIFFGVGLEYIKPYASHKVLNLEGSTGFNFFVGAEWILNKSGNGLNISIEGIGNSYLQNLSLAARYIYETQNTSWKYALLSGLSIGILPDLAVVVKEENINKNLTGVQNSFYNDNNISMKYEIGFRLRKNRHAIFLNIKLPLFPDSLSGSVVSGGYWTGYNFSKIKEKIYPFAFSLNYIYFLGL